MMTDTTDSVKTPEDEGGTFFLVQQTGLSFLVRTDADSVDSLPTGTLPADARYYVGYAFVASPTTDAAVIASLEVLARDIGLGEPMTRLQLKERHGIVVADVPLAPDAPPSESPADQGPMDTIYSIVQQAAELAVVGVASMMTVKTGLIQGRAELAAHYWFIDDPVMPVVVSSNLDDEEIALLRGGELPSDAQFHAVFLAVVVRFTDPVAVGVLRHRVVNAGLGDRMNIFELALRHQVLFGSAELFEPVTPDDLAKAVVNFSHLQRIRSELALPVSRCIDRCIRPQRAGLTATAFRRLGSW